MSVTAINGGRSPVKSFAGNQICDFTKNRQHPTFARVRDQF